MPADIPSTIRGQKYISLTTFRKNGAKVTTPVWFGEDGNKLYVMTRSDMGKTKRIRNNSQVRVAPCTLRGKLPALSMRLRRESCRRENMLTRERLSTGSIGWRGCH